MADFKEQYDSFIQTLEEKGVPNPRVLVPAALVLVVAAVLFLALPAFVPSDATVKFIVEDSTGKPVPNAQVTLLAGSKELSAVSSSLGEVQFKVPTGQKLQAKVSHPDYPELTQRITYDQGKIALQGQQAPPEQTFTMQVLSSDRAPIEDASIKFTTDDGIPQYKTTDTLGEAQADIKMPQVITVEITKEGYKTSKKSVRVTETARQLEVQIERIAQPTPGPDATPFIVTATDENGNAVEGARITLVDSRTQTPFKTGFTGLDGKSRFEGTSGGNLFTITAEDPQKRYNAYSSPYSYSTADGEAQIMLAAAAPDNQLEITAKDKSGNPIAEAEVGAYDKKTKGLITSVSTGSDGKATFTVDAAEVYVTAYKEGFMAFGAYVKSKEKKAVTLQAADGGTISVGVTVQKSLEPVPQADVQLFASTGFPLGVPSQATGPDGTALFEIPKQQVQVYAVASIDSDTGKSDTATASDNLQWVINIQPPKAPLRVAVTDIASQKPVSNAVVRLVAPTEKVSCKTQNGACQVDVPADTEFRVIVESPQYLPYQSATQMIPSGTKSQQINVKLYPKALTQAASVQFQGFFSESGKALREVGNAEKAVAKFAVTLPASTAQDSARFAVALGDDSLLAADITDTEGPAKFYTGTDPSQACNPASSEENATEGSKWASFDFPKGFYGTQQVTIEVYARPDAKAGTGISLGYSLHGINKGIPFLYPLDNEKLQQLLELPAPSDSDFCGAKYSQQKITVGKEAMACDDSLCKRMIFQTEDGLRSQATPEMKMGQKFYVDADFLGLQAGLSRASATAPQGLSLISLEDATNSAGNQTLLAESGGTIRTYQAYATANDNEPKTLTVMLDNRKGEKAKVRLTARALRATSAAELKFTVEDVDGKSTEITKNIAITGTNTFTVAVSPEELEAGLQQRVTVAVKDKFQKPVQDAAVTFYDCDAAPLNGQETEITENTRGIYTTQLQPSSVGKIGVRVAQAEFQTYEECLIPVNAIDFLIAEPEAITLKGDTDKDTVSEKITLSSVIGAKSKVSSKVACTSADGKKAGAQVVVAPKALTLKDTATVDVRAEKTTFRGRCDITFTARINKDNVATAMVSADIDVKGPVPPGQKCPADNANVKCMPASEGSELRCTRTALVCEDPSMGCFQCSFGIQTLPGQITLSVSNYQSDATQAYAIALAEQPEECRVEGFRNTPVNSQYGYNNPYGFNPYGYQQPGQPVAPYSQYNYQTNPMTPYGQNPFLPQTPDQQNSDYTLLVSKLSPYCQQFFQQQTPYNVNQNYYGNAYRDPWQNNLNPQYPSSNSFQYPQQRGAVSVTADCTRTEVRVSAQYTGGDVNYGGALGGNQQGFLLVRAGGQTKQIPILVTVQAPFGQGGSQYPFPQGYPTNQMPPQCLEELRLLRSTAAAQPQEGFDDTGLPETIEIKYNKYSGEGAYERELKAPAGSTLKYTQPTGGKVTLSYESGKLKATVKCKKGKEGAVECPSSVTYKAAWSFANLPLAQKERSVSITEDDFQPAVIQLLVPEKGKDSAEFEVSSSGDFSKAKCKTPPGVACKDGKITAEASGAMNAKLEVRGMGDYQIHSIPVVASTMPAKAEFDFAEDSEATEKTVKFTPSLTVAPTMEKGEKLKNLEAEATKEKLKLKATPFTGDAQSGFLEFTFDDSARSSEKKPQILVSITTKPAAKPEIEGISPDPATIGEPVDIAYKFPEGDDTAKRKITVLLEKDGKKIEEKAYTKYTETTEENGRKKETRKPLEQDGILGDYTPQQTGTLTVKAETEVKKKKLESEALSVEVNEKQEEGKAKILYELQVSRNKDSSGNPVEEISVTGLSQADAKLPEKWKKYLLVVKSAGTEIKMEGDTDPAKFSTSEATAYQAVLKGENYAKAKQALETDGSAAFTLTAYAADGSTLGRTEKTVAAADLGFTAAQGQTPAQLTGILKSLEVKRTTINSASAVVIKTEYSGSVDAWGYYKLSVNNDVVLENPRNAGTLPGTGNTVTIPIIEGIWFERAGLAAGGKTEPYSQIRKILEEKGKATFTLTAYDKKETDGGKEIGTAKKEVTAAELDFAGPAITGTSTGGTATPPQTHTSGDFDIEIIAPTAVNQFSAAPLLLRVWQASGALSYLTSSDRAYVNALDKKFSAREKTPIRVLFKEKGTQTPLTATEANLEIGGNGQILYTTRRDNENGFTVLWDGKDRAGNRHADIKDFTITATATKGTGKAKAYKQVSAGARCELCGIGWNNICDAQECRSLSPDKDSRGADIACFPFNPSAVNLPGWLVPIVGPAFAVQTVAGKLNTQCAPCDKDLPCSVYQYKEDCLDPQNRLNRCGHACKWEPGLFGMVGSCKEA